MFAETPSLLEVIAWSTTIGAGAGAGIGAALGTGYVIFTKRSMPARIEAMQAIDAAYKETIASKLEESLERNSRCEQRYKEVIEWKERVEGDMQSLRFDLEAERKRAEKAIEDLTTFATGILKAKGYLEAEQEAEHEPPAADEAPIAEPAT